MGKLKLVLLGLPEVLHNQRPVSFRTRKALGLLAYLAAEGRVHTRARLADLLWPGSAGSSGRVNLKSAWDGASLSLRAPALFAKEHVNLQFTKGSKVLNGMGLDALKKSEEALDQLRAKGMAPG